MLSAVITSLVPGLILVYGQSGDASYTEIEHPANHQIAWYVAVLFVHVNLYGVMRLFRYVGNMSGNRLVQRCD